MDKYLAMYKEDTVECQGGEAYCSEKYFAIAFKFFADLEDFWEYQEDTTVGGLV